jgi:hypothetical protein
MLRHIRVTRKSSDEDVLLLSVEVCDGVSVFVSEAYAQLDWGTTSAQKLRTFGRQLHGGLFDLEAGDGGPEYASGAFRARFHFFKPTKLLVSVEQQGDYFAFKNTTVAPEARMFLRTEPALLDRFIEALPRLDASDGGEAVLECIPLDA